MGGTISGVSLICKRTWCPLWSHKEQQSLRQVRKYFMKKCSKTVESGLAVFLLYRRIVTTTHWFVMLSRTNLETSGWGLQLIEFSFLYIFNVAFQWSPFKYKMLLLLVFVTSLYKVRNHQQQLFDITLQRNHQVVKGCFDIKLATDAPWCVWVRQHEGLFSLFPFVLFYSECAASHPSRQCFLTRTLLADDHTQVDGRPLGLRGVAVGAAPVGLVEPDLLCHFIVGKCLGNRFLDCFNPLLLLPLRLGSEAVTIDFFFFFCPSPVPTDASTLLI